VNTMGCANARVEQSVICDSRRLPMADFCNQCADAIGIPRGDLSNHHRPEIVPAEGHDASDYGWPALCEGCGSTLVDREGNCISKDCLENGHGNQKQPR
jgi:hypothetical protein